MKKFHRMQNQSSRLEKFAKGFIAFVGVVMIVAFIVQMLVIGYFIKYPESIGSWIYQLIKEINK